ncbi:hypothetical protein CCY99_05045 [Helicobacter sp. 16-1353]|nr:hypothetical protein CCY99_05045 [Helicobacter sp. 16-1353]
MLLRFINFKTALIFLAIFMLNPNTIYYAQELRNYAMLLGNSSIFCVICFIVYKIMQGKIDRKYANRFYIALALLGVSLVLTHYYAYIFIFSSGIIMICLSLKQKRFIKQTLLTFIFIGLVGIIWLGVHIEIGGLLDKILDSHKGLTWVHDGNLFSLIFSIILASLGKYGWGIFIISCIYLVVKYKLEFIKIVADYLPFILIIILELGIISLIYHFGTKTMTTRYFVMLYPFIYLFIAIVFSIYFKNLVPIILLSALILHSIYLSHIYKKEDIRAASEYVRGEFNPKNCKLPIGWIAYARYLPEYEIIEKPILQENCDLIFFGVDNSSDFKSTIETLKQHNISSYKIKSFNGGIVVVKDN